MHCQVSAEVFLFAGAEVCWLAIGRFRQPPLAALMSRFGLRRSAPISVSVQAIPGNPHNEK
jgi:hypothetical protein